MSSMRNAVQRRQHRERGQLDGREKWGILEKHKDYSLRAKDYNAKKAKLQRLREKARDRNPDEFAFGMLSDRTAKQGKHGAREAGQSLSNEAAKLLKTQDAGYLRTVGERIRREMERLEQEVQMQDGIQEVLGEGQTKQKDVDEEDDFFDFEEEEEDGKPQKVVFAESREEQRELGRELDQDSDEMDDDEDDDSFGQLSKKQQNQNQKKSKKQLEAEAQALRELRAARKSKKRAAEARRNKLQSLKKQYAEITAAERELEWQRGRMDNSVGGTNKNGVKWKIRERKK
ncbi:U3 small nucleolar RNA-associated protein Utp11, putative [Paecilomyces variotii No. 5]|uniref:U3 small nucleolar RNA-associated protein Utp11, putative n=1 Tax=Byssochlamys spectabilis (strain No. 5 / NBRC 109023) TaxID=1356009 RepID=V5G9Q5_BYSSN|nr:U3 small nucleolar RNA-associated protein Utp11, putative [Paecilomyces variotii No. 5]